MKSGNCVHIYKKILDYSFYRLNFIQWPCTVFCACIGRWLYIVWKVNSSWLSAVDCWCGCSLWKYFTDIEVGWWSVVITVVSLMKIQLLRQGQMGVKSSGNNFQAIYNRLPIPGILFILSTLFIIYFTFNTNIQPL
jgi:hypothetical protein